MFSAIRFATENWRQPYRAYRAHPHRGLDFALPRDRCIHRRPRFRPSTRLPLAVEPSRELEVYDGPEAIWYAKHCKGKLAEGSTVMILVYRVRVTCGATACLSKQTLYSSFPLSLHHSFTLFFTLQFPLNVSIISKLPQANRLLEK